MWQEVDTAETDEWRGRIEGSPVPAKATYKGTDVPRSIVGINLYLMQVRTRDNQVVELHQLRRDGDGLEIVYGPFADGTGGLTRVTVCPPEWGL